MRTRPTATRPAVPLTRSQVHRILSSSYYLGMVPYRGLEYEGKHPALVDRENWHRVQDMLSGRRIAGDRSWRHDHYLKGSLFCAHCDSRLVVSLSRGKSGAVYPYYYCLGRNKKRIDCQLPFLPVEAVERWVMEHWSTGARSSSTTGSSRPSGRMSGPSWPICAALTSSCWSSSDGGSSG